jgi:hypothetical protein
MTVVVATTNMKIVRWMFLAAALLPQFPANAAPPSIPDQFRGDWCDDDEDATTLKMHRCKTYSETNFRIGAHTYGAIKSNWDCTFTSINFYTVERGEKVSAVSSDSLCVRDISMRMRSIFQLNENGTLTFLTVDIGRR